MVCLLTRKTKGKKITSGYQPEPEYQIEYISCLYVVLEVIAGKRHGPRKEVASFWENKNLVG